MKIYRQFQPYRVSERPCVFLFGTFDGVHRGHQHLFSQAIELAKKMGYATALLTFQNHPAAVLRPEIPPPIALTTDAEKLSLIEPYGFDIVIDIEFTKAVSDLSAEQFIEKICTMLDVKIWLAGDDVAFGRHREGTKKYLLERSKVWGFEVQLLTKLCVGGVPISSSSIRTLISEGKLSDAEGLLGRNPRKPGCRNPEARVAREQGV